MINFFNPWLPKPRFFVIAVPYIWFLLFFLIPFAIVLKISFSEAAISIPPYTPLIVREDDVVQLTLKLGNYAYLWTDNLYISAYLSSLTIAFFTTLLCLLIGYPIAYAIANADSSIRNVLLMLVILPSWTSFLIRVYAWVGLLKNNGIINNFLIGLGVIDQPIEMLYTPFAVYVGLVYNYLPFMILPLYTNLVKMDHSLLEAAADLGCKPIKAFLTVTIPLSMGGIIAGSMLVFIPVVGEFIVPELLAGPDTLMIGKVLWQEFFNNRDWPVASSVAIIMLLLLIVPIIIFNRYQNRQTEA
ncbi:ABC-type spermidine/putrescine transport system, permease component I [Beggiatoa alba B18LD]|uniref:ABC-type spermidine/putrescine transport system, permease component I n=1 Tax=Beggiatoa alba B18LD TaxID=395493 RepID=I3CC69_9GAMM|nr:ABC transporter permease subunit [Beggiatoa alba]EIJ41212.1 ABC-type spermidine/putrescine transport system, permease component I [Beggiatoa alba B18LD]